jgi:rRNA maturation endonuclease Nob1
MAVKKKQGKKAVPYRCKECGRKYSTRSNRPHCDSCGAIGIHRLDGK